MVSTASQIDISTAGHRFDLDTGHAVLDFANTLQGRYDPQPDDLLRDYRDLLVFSLLAGHLDEADASRLAARAAASPADADRHLVDARRLREAIHAVFSAVAAGRPPAAGDLETLNAFHRQAARRGSVAAANDGFDWTWDDTDALDRPLWPLIRGAVELLLSDDLRRLRECAAHDCGWLFLDTSRNQSRRWCSMQSCGNRAKVHQFRERQKRGD